MAVACVTGLSVHFPGSCRTAVAVPAVAAAAGLEHRQMTDGEGEEAKLKSLVGRCQPLQGRNDEAGRVEEIEGASGRVCRAGRLRDGSTSCMCSFFFGV